MSQDSKTSAITLADCEDFVSTLKAHKPKDPSEELSQPDAPNLEELNIRPEIRFENNYADTLRRAALRGEFELNNDAMDLIRLYNQRSSQEAQHIAMSSGGSGESIVSLIKKRFEEPEPKIWVDEYPAIEKMLNKCKHPPFKKKLGGLIENLGDFIGEKRIYILEAFVCAQVLYLMFGMLC